MVDSIPSSQLVLPKSVAIISAFSVTFSIVSLVLSALNLTQRLTTSGWFSLIISAATVIFYGSAAIVLLLRLRKPVSGSYIVEKGLVHVPAFDFEREILCTMPMVTCLGIIFACWVVAVGTILYDGVMQPNASKSERANLAMMILETIGVAALAVRAYVRSRSLAAQRQSELAAKICRFTSTDLPRPLVLQRTLSNDSIAKPSFDSTRMSSDKKQDMTVVQSPPNSAGSAGRVSPPPGALRPEPRFNGARTLVLVDRRMEATSYHGSVSPPARSIIHG